MGASDTELDSDTAHRRRPLIARLTGRTPAARRHDKFIDYLRSSLWFRPGLWMIVLFGLALGLVAFDTWLEPRVDSERIPRLLRSHPDDARALFGAIVGAMLTVVSLAFSVMMVAVVQMSNAYSPRLLRSYIGDVHNQHVLGIFASVWGEFDDRDRVALDRACVFGTERTLRQDPRFGIEQLTDVALRALSPGINDPTTACAAINALTVLFGKLLVRERAALWRSDRSGNIRVEFRVASFAELVELSYLRILDYGAGDPQVVRRLIGACEQLEAVADGAEQRVVLWELLQAIDETARGRITFAAHRRTIDAEYQRARAALGQPWNQSRSTKPASAGSSSSPTFSPLA